MEFEKITHRIIGRAMEGHREPGPGFLESIYEAALVIALRDAGISFAAQLPVPVRFRGRLVGDHRLDLLVEKRIVVELKAAKALEDIHFAQVRSYLKAGGPKHGLQLSFATTPLTVKRVLHDSPSGFPAFPIQFFSHGRPQPRSPRHSEVAQRQGARGV